MKLFLTSFVAALALVLSVRADETAKISDVHLCCDSCVKGVQKTVATVPGLTATCSKDDNTITLTAADKATLQKGADALTAVGFFGTSTDVKIDASTGAKDKSVQTLKVSDTHICCGKCVKAIDKAVKSVPGVTGVDAKKGDTSFTVTGDFNDKAVFDALQKAGLTGKEKD
jgi:copper chaperone CopZ